MKYVCTQCKKIFRQNEIVNNGEYYWCEKCWYEDEEEEEENDY